MATSVRITSAPETSDRAMQPQTKPPRPRVSKKRTLKVVFSLQLFCLSAAPPGSPPEPKSCAARLSGGHNRWSRTSKGIPSSLWVHQTRTNPPHVDPLPPTYALPRPRSDPRDVDDVSMGRAHPGLGDLSNRPRMSWWIPSDRPSASTASPGPLLPRQQPRGRPRGERLQSEGTDDALRRTWSALRSIQVVVCLVVNAIEAIVHPRHPLRPRGSPGPSPPSLGNVVGKVASDLASADEHGVESWPSDRDLLLI